LKLKKDDVLICRTNGNPNLVGRSALVAEDTEFAYASYLFKIRPKADIINSATLVAFLSSKYGRKEIDKYSMTSNQTNFSPAKFREIDIPLFSNQINNEIENLYSTAFDKLKHSENIYRQAEELLLDTIGFQNPPSLEEGKCCDISGNLNSPPLEGCPKGGVVKKRHTQNYMSLPYNLQLKERAKALRKAGMLHEVLVWNLLKKGGIEGLDFDRQKIIGNYIVDFFCAEKNVVIEIDGSSHDDKGEYDAQRDEFLKSLGLEVIHIQAKDVLQRFADVERYLRDFFTTPSACGCHPSKGGEFNSPPFTRPSNEGELASRLKEIKATNYNIKSFKESFLATGRLDAEYYQPKYEEIIAHIETFETERLNKIVSIKKSIEPGSDAYETDGIPFIRVSNLSKFGLTDTDIYLNKAKFGNLGLQPKKDTIFLSKDGSVGIAYKVEQDLDVITSGALLHLTVTNEDFLPDYVTLVLNSEVVKMQAERDAGGSIIQHWKPSEIEQVIIPKISMQTQQQISALIQDSFVLRKESERLLAEAKGMVEKEIERK
jgi:very-short-patch-repair endonuclease/restriction endonuclease S subunit